MEIEIIPLALKKMKLRGISIEWVKETIQSPDQTVLGYLERKIRQKIYRVGDKEMLLRVVGEREDDKFVVITAYLTSQIRKYWREEK